MDINNLSLYLTKKNTKFREVFIKKLPLKLYFETLIDFRILRKLESRLIELQLTFKKKEIDKKSFKELYNHISELYQDYYTKIIDNCLICKDSFYYKFCRILKINQKKILKSALKNKLILLKSEWKNVKIYNPILLFKILRYHVFFDNTRENLKTEIFQYNYPELFTPKTPDHYTISEEKETFDIYTRFLASLSERFTQSEIDNMYIEQARDLIDLINQNKAKDFIKYNYQLAKFQNIANPETIFKHDKSGSKKQKILDNFENYFKQLAGEKKTENSYMRSMKNKAMQILIEERKKEAQK